MSRHWIAAVFALAACALPCLGSAALAIEIINPANQGALARQNDAQLRALQDQFQRQQFQQLQQQNREVDRRTLPLPQPQVPTIRPTCRTEPYASSLRTVCR